MGWPIPKLGVPLYVFDDCLFLTCPSCRLLLKRICEWRMCLKHELFTPWPLLFIVAANTFRRNFNTYEPASCVFCVFSTNISAKSYPFLWCFVSVSYVHVLLFQNTTDRRTRTNYLDFLNGFNWNCYLDTYQKLHSRIQKNSESKKNTTETNLSPNYSIWKSEISGLILPEIKKINKLWTRHFQNLNFQLLSVFKSMAITLVEFITYFWVVRDKTDSSNKIN